jgi:hypothetical protein
MFLAMLLPEALFAPMPNIHCSELEVYLLKVEPSSPIIDYDRVGKKTQFTCYSYSRSVKSNGAVSTRLVKIYQYQ